jgi:aldehyde:ferredoxin oxidoreductase
MKTYDIKGGLTGRILRIDLSTGKVWTEETKAYAGRFLGGRTLASYLLLKELDPSVKWSDPANMLIFSPGVLDGTFIPGASRTSIDSKNVYNNAKGSANFGGNFGPELKLAGYDMLVITGKAEKPVYLWIHDKVEIRDARSVWGKTILETDKILREELEDERIELACIGPAGENLVKAACIVGNCGKVGGGSGLGCVMGNKGLKAVVVHGHKSVKPAVSSNEFIEMLDRIRAKIEKSHRTKLWQDGTLVDAAGMAPEAETLWAVRSIVRNGQDDYWSLEKRKNIVGVGRYIKAKIGCFSCPLGCMPHNEIKDGRHAGTVGNGYWIQSLWWSQMLDIDDPEMSMKYHCELNDLGLDGDNATGPIAWAFECFEKGLLTKEDTDGLDLKWGDGDVAVEMLRKLAYRQGIGNLLADGVREASRKLGKGSDRFALHMKGQPTVDPYRVRKGWALGLATSPISGRHIRGSVGSEVLFGPNRYTFKASGFKLNLDETGYEYQSEVVDWQGLMKELEDTMGLCMYMGTYVGGPLSPEDYLDALNAVLGVGWSMEDMMFFARRAINLEKAFNTVHVGFTRDDDLPPARYMEEAVKTGPFMGEKIDKDKFNKMLDRYYELRGWDKKTGLQTLKCLVDLGLEDVAEMIKRVNKLVER